MISQKPHLNSPSYRTNKKEMEYEQIFLDSRKRFEYNTIVEFGLEE
jgi:hypothetical protein